jgi:hypothetical protein
LLFVVLGSSVGKKRTSRRWQRQQKQQPNREKKDTSGISVVCCCLKRQNGTDEDRNNLPPPYSRPQEEEEKDEELDPFAAQFPIEIAPAMVARAREMEEAELLLQGLATTTINLHDDVLYAHEGVAHARVASGSFVEKMMVFSATFRLGRSYEYW